MKRTLTCIECPLGCEITVELFDGQVVSVSGHSCLRGKTYAENEVICPKRVITSTVKTTDGRMVSVKTDIPVKKTETFTVMEKIKTVTVTTPVKIGDVLVENISDGANLVATDEA